jgi:hypothetical protein
MLFASKAQIEVLVSTEESIFIFFHCQSFWSSDMCH